MLCGTSELPRKTTDDWSGPAPKAKASRYSTPRSDAPTRCGASTITDKYAARHTFATQQNSAK